MAQYIFLMMDFMRVSFETENAGSRNSSKRNGCAYEGVFEDENASGIVSRILALCDFYHGSFVESKTRARRHHFN